MDRPLAKRLIITPGEPAGIGAEILVEAAHHGASPLITIDDPERLKAAAAASNRPLEIAAINQVSEADHLPGETLAVLPVRWAEPPVAGQPSPANASQVIDAIRTAAILAKDGKVKGIVTNPIQKSTLYAAGFKSPGHTEFLGELDGPQSQPVMMLANSQLKVVPLTIHIPLKEVPAAITADKIAATATVLDDSLRRDFGHDHPRIAVAGLNPHAGEDGTIGREDRDIIAPAIADLRRGGMNISGPFSADTLFHEDRRQDYDAVIAMYHDQALIPVKSLDFHGGVNITLGLSYIRTSPDHGTALDQAGKGTANPQSLMAAITMAETMAANRRGHHA
ncbi:MAG: 4-hydroxythreonine-4-phosphate dehydrogenase PdxA [Alphaproteobacteria bacterium]|nr:4-hydroxythreonine-4-phosphate dehydrogenase PdxA [Alphaproteobacteria bacterium]